MLQISHLYKNYGKFQAVRDLNLHVPKGDLFGFVGPNGAGKTTTLHAVTGLTPVKSGHIFFEGKDITKVPAHKIVSMGMAHVPEGRRVFAQLSVYQNLKMGAYTRKDKDEIRQTLDMVYEHFPRLEERKNQMAGTLSGGEQQMLTVARGLMQNPTMILLDEITEGLAPIVVDQLAEIVSQLRKMNVSILVAEQSVKFALAVSDDCYILEKGNVVLHKPTAELTHEEILKYLGT